MSIVTLATSPAPLYTAVCSNFYSATIFEEIRLCVSLFSWNGFSRPQETRRNGKWHYQGLFCSTIFCSPTQNFNFLVPSNWKSFSYSVFEFILYFPYFSIALQEQKSPELFGVIFFRPTSLCFFWPPRRRVRPWQVGRLLLWRPVVDWYHIKYHTDLVSFQYFFYLVP